MFRSSIEVSSNQSAWTAPGCPVDRSKLAYVQIIKIHEIVIFVYFLILAVCLSFNCFVEIIYTTFDIKSKEAILVLNAFQIDYDHLNRSELLGRLTLIGPK